MAKKLNQAERVAAMLDEEKVRAYITEHTLYPAVLVGGTKADGEEKVRYRCAHCRHEWDKVYPNYYARSAKSLVCPKCKKRMFAAKTLPRDNNKSTSPFQIYDGVQIRNYRYFLYVDAAILDDTPGIIVSEYDPSIVFEYSDVPESFEVKLELTHYGFISASHKILFNYDGSKTSKFLYNAFCGWNCITVASDDALALISELPWMQGYTGYEGNSWLNAFDTYWSRRDTGTRKPLGELHAEQTLDTFDVPEFPEVVITAKQIVSRDVSEDVITGKHHMEYCCMSCGARFSSETVYSRSNVECPECGLSTGRESRLIVGNTYEDVGVLSMLDDNTVLLRAGKITCTYDEDFIPAYERQELYRAIIELNPGNDPRVHFLVNEGYGDKVVWVKKKNYASSKFHYSIKQLEYLDDLEALKYTGLREFIDYKVHKSAYSHSVPIADIIHYIRFQSLYPIIEQLCKRGFVYTLEDEIHHRINFDKTLSLDLSQRKVADVVGLPERLIKIYLKDSDSHSRLETFKELYRLDPNVREEDIAWLELHGVQSAQVADIMHESQMSIMRLCEYLEHVRINQCFEPKNAITDWRDYLHAAKTIEVDLTDNKARYPSSLKREHDRAVAKQKLVLDAKKDEFFQAETERYGKLYSYKTDEYMIIPPRDMKDLFEEGRKLNHCVGSYSDRIVEGKTCIMFVRRAKEPDKPWTATAITKILTNRVYTGCLVQGKRHRPNYKVKKAVPRAEENWIITEDTHEAIVSKAEFEIVQRLLLVDSRISGSNDTVHLLSGLMFCGDCHQLMSRRCVSYKDRRYVYYECASYKRNKKECFKHSIKEDDIFDALLEVINKHIASIVEIEKMLRYIEKLPEKEREAQLIDRRIQKLQTELERNNNYKRMTFEKYAEGIINEKMFQEYSAIYTKKCDDIVRAIENHQKELDKLVFGKASDKAWIKYFKQYGNVRKLDRVLLVMLVDRIEVYGNSSFRVVFRYQDQYDIAKKYINEMMNKEDAYGTNETP